MCAVGRKLRVKIAGDIAKTHLATKPDVAVLCTSSSLKRVVPEFEAVLKLKVPIVSTTEELAYPVRGNAALARKIDALAKRSRVAVLGTGVNPGFTMDALPIALTGVCESVTAIEVARVQDASVRRLPFQQKIGAGLTREEFMQKVNAGTVRHVGLAESIAMIADAMGWKLDKVTDEIEPKICERETPSQFLPSSPARSAASFGMASGTARASRHPLWRHILSAGVLRCGKDQRNPPRKMMIAGGVRRCREPQSPSIPSPRSCRALGLRTMRDMALPSYFGGVREVLTIASGRGRRRCRVGDDRGRDANLERRRR